MSQEEKALEFSKRKTSFYKVRSSTKFYKRDYWIDLENMRLYYSPTKKLYFCRSLPYGMIHVLCRLFCPSILANTVILTISQYLSFATLASSFSLHQYICAHLVDLSDAIEVRSGRKTDRFNPIEARIRRLRDRAIEKGKHFDQVNYFPQDARCLSIIFENKSKTVDLVAADNETRNAWYEALKLIIDDKQARNNNYHFGNWIEDLFKQTDTNGNGTLSLCECIKLAEHFNVSLKKKKIEELFQVNSHYFSLLYAFKLYDLIINDEQLRLELLLMTSCHPYALK